MYHGVEKSRSKELRITISRNPGRARQPAAVLRAGCVLALAAVLAACSKPPEKAPDIRPVQTQTVVPGGVDDSPAYSGEVRARHEADLGFRVAGKIVARKVDVGAVVKKGQLLAQIDAADARLNAEAAQAQVATAETEFSFAQAELARYRDLMEKKFISQSFYDGKLNSYKSAQARLEQARAQHAVSLNQSEYTSLAADADGVITAVLAEAGQVVAVGQAVVRLARTQEKEVLISVPENRVAELSGVKQVGVIVLAQPAKIYRGRVRELSPVADAATRTYAARISIIDADVAVQLGMTAAVRLARPGDPQVVVLPLTAIYQKDGAPAVWVVDPAQSKVELREVKIGQYREEGVGIAAGLRAGEIVVTAGAHKLVPGQQVRLNDAPAAAGASSLPAAPK